MTFKPTQWSESLELGILWMDHQHRTLVEMSGRLYHDFEKGETEGHLQPAFEFLCDYARGHFELEEKYMVEYGYSLSELHCQEHKQFVDTLERFITETGGLRSGDDELSIPSLCIELESWILMHIYDSDRELASFIREREGERWRSVAS